MRFCGTEFQKHLFECQEHSLLTEKQVGDAKKSMHAYFLTLGKTNEQRFPELEFMTRHFRDPPQRG